MAMYPYHKDPFNVQFGPIMRMICDLGDDTKIVGAMDTGVEQRAMGPHRVDFMQLFTNGKYIDMPSVGIPKKEPVLKITKVER